MRTQRFARAGRPRRASSIRAASGGGGGWPTPLTTPPTYVDSNGNTWFGAGPTNSNLISATDGAVCVGWMGQNIATAGTPTNGWATDDPNMEWLEPEILFTASTYHWFHRPFRTVRDDLDFTHEWTFTTVSVALRIFVALTGVNPSIPIEILDYNGLTGIGGSPIDYGSTAANTITWPEYTIPVGWLGVFGYQRYNDGLTNTWSVATERNSIDTTSGFDQMGSIATLVGDGTPKTVSCFENNGIQIQTTGGFAWAMAVPGV